MAEDDTTENAEYDTAEDAEDIVDQENHVRAEVDAGDDFNKRVPGCEEAKRAVLWDTQDVRDTGENSRNDTCEEAREKVDLGSKACSCEPSVTRKRGDKKLRERVRNHLCEHSARCGRCNLGTNDQCERRRVRKRVSLGASEEHEDWGGEHG